MGCSPCNGKDIIAKSNTIENDISDNSSAQPEITINCAYEECIINKETAKTPQVEMEINEKEPDHTVNSSEKEQKKETSPKVEERKEEPKQEEIKELSNINSPSSETVINNEQLIKMFPNIENQSTEVILYKSTLQKMITIPYKKTKSYIERFCFITREAFVIFQSEEAFFTLKSPLGILPADEIIKVVRFKVEETNKKYDHFYISFKKNILTEKFYEQINKCLFEDESNDALVMFKSDDISIIKKWYLIINYLINCYKSKTN